MTTNPHLHASGSGAANNPPSAAAAAACSGRHPFPPSRLLPVVAHTLSQSGFSHYSQHSLDVLCDVFERYLLLLASRAATHALHANRPSAKANLVDLQAALANLNVDLESLHEFVNAGWTKKLNHLDYDLTLDSVPTIPIPSKHQLAFYKEAALRDDRWVLPPNFGWPLLVPCDMVLDHTEFDPLDPLFVTCSSMGPPPESLVVHQQGRLHPNRPSSAIDASPIYDHTGNSFPLHIPTHLPPLPVASSAASASKSTSARGYPHHLAVSPTSMSQDPWAPTSPTHDTGKKKPTITVSGNAKALASIAGNAAPGTNKVELDLDLVRTSIDTRQWRLPAPPGSTEPTGALSPTKPVMQRQAPPLRANPNTARHLRTKRAASPPRDDTGPSPSLPLLGPTRRATARTHRPASLLGRALNAATSLSRTPVTAHDQAPGSPSAAGPAAAVSARAPATSPRTPLTAPPLLPAYHAAHPAAHRLATAAHADSLYTPSGTSTLVPGAATSSDADPVFPRVDLLPVLAAGPRARPVMDDMACAGCPVGDARKTMDDGQLLVQCSQCRKWSHGKCVGVTKEAISAGTVREFWCSECRRRALQAGSDIKREAGGQPGGRAGRGGGAVRKRGVSGR